MEIAVSLLMYVFVIGVIIVLFVWVGDMAKARGHSPWPWWILSFFTSPFLAIIIMWLFISKK